MKTSSDSEQRDRHIDRIISEPIEIIESEHGLAGLDRVLELVQERRNAAIFALEDERRRGLT